MPLHVTLNGEPSDLDLDTGASLQTLIRQRGLREDRVAVERNGEIVPRTRWPETAVLNGDRLEIVHFVGGGSPPPAA